MPALAHHVPSPVAPVSDLHKIKALQPDRPGQTPNRSRPVATRSSSRKRRLSSDPDASTQEAQIYSSSPVNRKLPRRSFTAVPNGIVEESEDEEAPALRESAANQPKWDPRDVEQMSAVKEALHVSMAPPTVVCREDEQNRVLEFCKACVEQEKAGSLYACGCPGTGKSLSMGKVNRLLIDWSKEAGFHSPDVLSINCTSLAKTSEIFSKILGKLPGQKKLSGSISPLQQLRHLYSVNQQSHDKKMLLIIVDELDYLITKDCAALHDLFMLATLPFAKCILIGVANAIDLTDRFLPRLQSLSCKPMVVTFRAYNHNEILKILQERLMVFPYAVFQTRALELCARKVAAASGDMRKALSVCRCAIEMLEMEVRESTSNILLTSAEEESFDHQTALAPAPEFAKKQEIDVVRVDHMALALSRAYKSSIVDTIQLLPQHQQIILCSTVKLFRGKKKDATVGEMNKCYIDICKTSLIPSVGFLEFSSMCRVLADQGLLKISQTRDEKTQRVTLKVDEADITFALQGVRFFRNCLQ